MLETIEENASTAMSPMPRLSLTLPPGDGRRSASSSFPGIPSVSAKSSYGAEREDTEQLPASNEAVAMVAMVPSPPPATALMSRIDSDSARSRAASSSLPLWMIRTRASAANLARLAVMISASANLSSARLSRHSERHRQSNRLPLGVRHMREAGKSGAVRMMPAGIRNLLVSLTQSLLRRGRTLTHRFHPTAQDPRTGTTRSRS